MWTFAEVRLVARDELTRTGGAIAEAGSTYRTIAAATSTGGASH
ncbi:hypothetical protein [Dactylosporangium sp. CA-233914]